MLLPGRFAGPSDCPYCGVALSVHPADGCTCTHVDCHERATTTVQVRARATASLHCDRHVRADLATAERFGYALVLMGIPQDVPLPLS